MAKKVYEKNLQINEIRKNKMKWNVIRDSQVSYSGGGNINCQKDIKIRKYSSFKRFE